MLDHFKPCLAQQCWTILGPCLAQQTKTISVCLGQQSRIILGPCLAQQGLQGNFGTLSSGNTVGPFGQTMLSLTWQNHLRTSQAQQCRTILGSYQPKGVGPFSRLCPAQQIWTILYLG